MATITTDFTNSVSRSRAERSSAGVVAGYIRELAAAPTQANVSPRRVAAGVSAQETVSASADTVGAAAYISAARGRGEGSTRRSSARGRGERGGCAFRAKRMLGSR